MINPIDSSQGLNNIYMPGNTNINHQVCGQCQSTSTDSLSLSINAKSIQRIESLEKELDGILGAPKELSDSEKKQEQKIIAEIEKMLGSGEGSGIPEAARKRMDGIYQQIDKIFEDDKITEDEEHQLSALSKRLDKMFETYQPPELTDADQKKLDELDASMAKLYGFKEPTKDELLKVEKILDELDGLYSQFENETDQYGYEAGNQINDNSVQAPGFLQSELNGIFGMSKILSETEQQIEQNLLSEIDKIFGNNEGHKIPAESQRKIDKVFNQMDKIFADGNVSVDEEKQLTDLGKRLDKLTESYQPPKLNENEEKKLEELYSKLDGLYGIQTPSKEEILKI